VRRKVSIETLESISKALDIPTPLIVYWGSSPGELATFSKDVEKSMNEVIARLLRERAATRRISRRVTAVSLLPLDAMNP